MNAKEVWIVVPGTYSADYDWYQPEGDFFQGLKRGLANEPDASLVSFRWSGGITDKERLRGAKMLKELIQSYPDDARIHVVAHSHGGNVSIVCTQLMAEEAGSRKIDTLFLLGTPIHKKRYHPEYRKVDRVINLFSFNDDVQPVFSWFERELSEHSQCANFRVFLNGIAPTHTTIHDPIIARWLPTLRKVVTFPAPKAPRCVYITENEKPRIARDYFCRILQKEDIENHNGYWYHLGSFKRNLMEWFEISPDMLSFHGFKKMINSLHLACAYGVKNTWQKVRSKVRFS